MSRRIQLAARRKACGFSQESLSHLLGVSSNSVARWEQGTNTPLANHRGPLAEALDLSLDRLDRLLQADDNLDLALSGHAVPKWLSLYASLEQGAALLQTFEPITIPGLFQTAGYAAAVLRTYYQESVSDETIEQHVQARIARQAVLEREPEPLELVCVLDESVLHRLTGSCEIMAAQLLHLVNLAERPSVQLRVVPTSKSAAIHCAAFGSFQMFSSLGATAPFTVCTEDMTGFNYQDRSAAIQGYIQLFERLMAATLTNDQSANLVQTTAEELTK